MDLKSGRAVFKVIADGLHVIREFAGFSKRDESYTQFPGNQRSKNEPARFHAGNGRDISANVGMEQVVHGQSQRGRVFDERRNVFEENSRLWKIRNIPNGRSKPLHIKAPA